MNVKRMVLSLACMLLLSSATWALPLTVASSEVNSEKTSVGSQASGASGGGLVDASVSWPSRDQVVRVLTLHDYNTRIVVLGVTGLGAAGAVIGSFMLLRKRALMGDALSHATLPGIAGTFILLTSLGYNGKNLYALLIGAALSGIAGVLCILLIRRVSRIKEDAALGIVLSVFFGFGICLLSVVQKMEAGSSAGLSSFIYGKTASMVAQDAWLICISAGLIVIACGALFKELSLLCFDQGYAASLGWPVLLLDVVLMSLVTLVTVVGLQAVGLILVIAMLIIPPAAARFWTHHLRWMMFVGVLVGALSGWLGASLSALVPRLPAGAIIVLVAASIFLLSMVFGKANGMLVRGMRRWRLSVSIRRQHLLRAMYEWHELDGEHEAGVHVRELLKLRSWTRSLLSQSLKRAQKESLVYCGSHRRWNLTEQGQIQASRICRNHRLWEMYLIQYADIAPSHVDRDADQIEHVLGEPMVRKLEKLLAQKLAEQIPPSPHVLVTGEDQP
ncbi:MAG: metal ABC transporter permease [Phycisphaeraceae bacterium]|nr:metal ABC transporter permease [Phycisphaeraceae bacterium]